MHRFHHNIFFKYAAFPFNVYMDDLSIKLNQSNIAGDIGGHLISHFMLRR